MTRTTFRSSGDTRSPTRTGTRKSAIVRPFSVTGTRVSDGIAMLMVSLDGRRTGCDVRASLPTGGRDGHRHASAGVARGEATGLLLSADRAHDRAGARDPC